MYFSNADLFLFKIQGQHRRGGFLNVEKAEVTFRDDLFFSAGKELGFETGLDPNGPQRVGNEF